MGLGLAPRAWRTASAGEELVRATSAGDEAPRIAAATAAGTFDGIVVVEGAAQGLNSVARGSCLCVGAFGSDGAAGCGGGTADGMAGGSGDGASEDAGSGDGTSDASGV